MLRESQWKHMDIFRRKLFLKNEIKRIVLKGIIKNSKLPLSYRYLALFNKSKLFRSSSKTQHQNRCAKTGRIWGVNKYSHYSRFLFRTESYKGNIPGFGRSSW